MRLEKSKPFRILIKGKFALFSKPEFKSERVSYAVPTPNALKGILESVYWKPQMKWVVTDVHVLSPINYHSQTCSELKHKQSTLSDSLKLQEEHRTLRHSLILKDVSYVVTAHIVVTDPTDHKGQTLTNPLQRHYAEASKRFRKGQHRRMPYLGCKDYPAHLKRISRTEAEQSVSACVQNQDLGQMLHYFEYVADKKGKITHPRDNQTYRIVAHTFHAILQDGHVTYPPIP